MFRGSHGAKIDDRGRLKIPSDFRRILEENYGADVFITSVEGEAAQIYPLPVWEEVEAQLRRVPRTDRPRQRYLKRLSYYGQQTKLDSQGRIVVPPRLREAAGIDGEVIVTGQIDILEVWNREAFDKSLEEEPLTEDDFRELSLRGV